jgi:multidrug efflux pump subunit AcrA (membrane-fusion protein)
MNGTPPKASELFRTEALTSRRQGKLIGDVIAARPLSFDLAAAAAGVMVLSLGFFSAVCTYTPRTMVAGQLVPKDSIAKGAPEQPGTIVGIKVREGQIVKKGDVLYEMQIMPSVRDVREGEGAKSLAVVAPIDGVATAVDATVGDYIPLGRAVVSIIPNELKLCAKLLVPPSAIRFVKKGDKVRLRYDAFPYQEFGTYGGTIAVISRTPVGSSDAIAGSAQQPASRIGPTYEVLVNLESQSVKIHGKSEGLLIGMAVSADIPQDTRPIYQWLLDPLYTLAEKDAS